MKVHTVIVMLEQFMFVIHSLSDVSMFVDGVEVEINCESSHSLLLMLEQFMFLIHSV